MQAFSSLKLLCSGFLAEAGAAVPAKTAPLITDDAVILGILLVVLAAIFKTASLKHPFWKKFYTFCPVLLLCYFIPSLLGSLGIVATDKDGSKLYFVTKNYLLPTSLVLLTLSIDLKGIIGLGPKALILFLTGTVGILFGGPLAILIVSAFSPEMVAGDGPEAVWRGMATCAATVSSRTARPASRKCITSTSNRPAPATPHRESCGPAPRPARASMCGRIRATRRCRRSSPRRTPTARESCSNGSASGPARDRLTCTRSPIAPTVALPFACAPATPRST